MPGWLTGGEWFCRAGIVPLDNTSDIAGPLGRSVADVARLLEVLAGQDPADPLTELSAFQAAPANYTRYLDAGGLKVALHVCCILWSTCDAEHVHGPGCAVLSAIGFSLAGNLSAGQCLVRRPALHQGLMLTVCASILGRTPLVSVCNLSPQHAGLAVQGELRFDILVPGRRARASA